MNTFINFLIDHYIWFLVITIVLLFSLIGYLVESSKLPKEEKPPKEAKIKEPKPKKEKKKKKKKEKDEDILEDNTPTIEEAMKKEALEQKFEILDPDVDNKIPVSDREPQIEVQPAPKEIELPEVKSEEEVNKS